MGGSDEDKQFEQHLGNVFARQCIVFLVVRTTEHVSSHHGGGEGEV